MIEFNREKDLAYIIAPASAVKDEQGKMDISLSIKKLKFAISLFNQYGIVSIYDPKIFTPNTLEYFAAPKEERFRQLKEAIENPDVKIISAFRGGYGSSEIVFDCLNIKPSGPKILIGFSDITALHFLFNQYYNFPSIHGAVSVTHENMMEKIISILKGVEPSFDLELVNATNERISGKISGGNLSLICNMIGTKISPDTKDKILIVEDIKEAGYRVHRNLLHMFNAGLFNSVRAVIFADFVQSDAYLEESINNFIQQYLYEIPVFKTSKIGHGDINYPFISGGQGEINNKKLIIKNPFKLV